MLSILLSKENGPTGKAVSEKDKYVNKEEMRYGTINKGGREEREKTEP